MKKFWIFLWIVGGWLAGDRTHRSGHAATSRPAVTSHPSRLSGSSRPAIQKTKATWSAIQKRTEVGLAWLRQGTIPQRKEAVLRLGSLAVMEPRVRKALIDALQDPHQEVRFLAALSISRWGMVAIPSLRAALTSKTPKIRWAAAFAVAQIQPVTPESRAILIQLSHDDFFRVRYEAVRGLSQEAAFSMDSRKAMLYRLWHDPHPVVRLLVSQALQRIPVWSVPIWLRLVDTDRHPLVRRLAARLVAHWAGSKQTVRHRLLQALTRETDHDVAVALLQLWRTFWNKHQTSIPEIRQLWDIAGHAKHWQVRREMAEMLGWFAHKGQQETRWLQQLLLDPVAEVRHSAQIVWKQWRILRRKEKNHP